MKQPVCYIIAGPNGAGKTTFALEFLPHVAKCKTFVNADLIARGLSPLNADVASIEAGRLFLGQIKSRIEKRESFAFESTLSGTNYLRWINLMQKEGYAVRLYYLWIPTVGLTLRRIAERVEKGGHSIPNTVARRRFGKSLQNLFNLYLPASDYCAIFDNSSMAPKLVYEREGKTVRLTDTITFAKICKGAGIS